jgi:hypothetical protein
MRTSNVMRVMGTCLTVYDSRYPKQEFRYRTLPVVPSVIGCGFWVHGDASELIVMRT